MKQSRRSFLKDSILIGSGLSLISNGIYANSLSLYQSGRSLKGFIVSDAHFGWLGKDQPTNGEIFEAINRITARFPDLDLFIDTGDAFHNYAREKSKGDWLENIANACNALPFFYVAGNHENMTSRTLPAPWVDYDSEMECAKLGSLPFELYYSFDVKGIHFISLPQLMNQAYITDAEIAWLKLDLKLAGEKSVIILSHNSLADTTEYFSDIGYRQTANSAAILEIINSHKNIIAWMHGHNHTYEIVPKYDMVFVSNGRIGGFNPGFPGSYGKDNLGGIYFEISKNHFLVRGYSATNQCFIDELNDHSHMIYSSGRKTSFLPDAGISYYCGAGKQTAGTKSVIYKHFSSGKKSLLVQREENPIINENPDFKIYTQRKNKNWRTKHLAGYSFLPVEENDLKEDNTWEWTGKGVKILKRNSSTDTKTIFTPELDISHRSYYKCVPGKKYKVELTVSCEDNRSELEFVFLIHDRNYSKIWEKRSGKMSLKQGTHSYNREFNIPEFSAPENIYNSGESVNSLHFATGAAMSNITSDIMLRKMEIKMVQSSHYEKNSNVNMTINGEKILTKPGSCESILDKLSAQEGERYFDTIQVGQDETMITWILEQKSPEWQVRNATVTQYKNTLSIGPLRNRFNNRDEIVIVPLASYAHPFLHKSRGIENLEVKLFDSKENLLEIKVREVSLNGSSELEIWGYKPENVANAVSWNYENNKTIIRVNRNSKISVYY